jgi:hypothetical protein
LTEEELESYNTLVDSTAKVHPSSVLFTPSPESQVVAIPHNILQSKDDSVNIVRVPTSPATSSSGVCSSPASGTVAAKDLAALSAGGKDEAGDTLCGGADPEGTATCALAVSIASASVKDSATASIISNVGAGDGTAGGAAGTVLDAADTPGGSCTAPAAGLPAATATGASLLETVETATMEGVERDTADQSGEKDLTPDTATLAAAVVPSTSLRRSKRVAAVADVHTLHKVEFMAAKRNLESKGISFTSFSDSQILSNLGRIGINLGTSYVAVIKNLEVDRLVLCAKQKRF